MEWRFGPTGTENVKRSLTDESRSINIPDDDWKMKRDDSPTLDLGKICEETVVAYSTQILQTVLFFFSKNCKLLQSVLMFESNYVIS